MIRNKKIIPEKQKMAALIMECLVNPGLAQQFQLAERVKMPEITIRMSRIPYLKESP